MPDIEHLTRLIAGHLPDWTADTSKFGHIPLYHCEKKWQINLEISRRDNGRIVARGIYHQHDWWNLVGHQTKTPKITVAILRGPAIIAKEIERRLLPKYIELYNEIEAGDHERQARINEEIDAMNLVAEVTHSAIPKDQLRNIHDNNGGLSVRFGQYDNHTWPQGRAGRFYEGRLNLELNRLTPQETATVLEKLIELRSEAAQ